MQGWRPVTEITSDKPWTIESIAAARDAAVRERRTRASRRSSSQLAEAERTVHLAWGDEELRSATSSSRSSTSTRRPRRSPRLRLRRTAAPTSDAEIIPAVGARVAGDALRPRLDDPGLPTRARRPERHAGADARVPRGDGAPAHPALAALPRLRDRRPEPARVRQRRAAARSCPPRSAATRSGASG